MIFDPLQPAAMLDRFRLLLGDEASPGFEQILDAIDERCSSLPEQLADLDRIPIRQDDGAMQC
jgi:hypothetical protein